MEERNVNKQAEDNESKRLLHWLSMFDVLGENSLRQIVLSLPFILFLLVLAFLHIANNHYADQFVRDISRSERDLKLYRWQYMTLSSKLMKASKRSAVAKRVEESGLKELRQAPYTLEVASPNPSEDRFSAKHWWSTIVDWKTKLIN